MIRSCLGHRMFIILALHSGCSADSRGNTKERRCDAWRLTLLLDFRSRLFSGANLFNDLVNRNAFEKFSSLLCVVAMTRAIQPQEARKTFGPELALENRECMALKFLISHFVELHS